MILLIDVKRRIDLCDFIDSNNDITNSNAIFLSSIYNYWNDFKSSTRYKINEWNNLDKKSKKQNYVLKREKNASSPITTFVGKHKIGKSTFFIELSSKFKNVMVIDALKFKNSKKTWVSIFWIIYIVNSIHEIIGLWFE